MVELVIENDRLERWLSTSFLGGDGEIFLPAGAFDDELTAVLCLACDSVRVVGQCRREPPQLGEILMDRHGEAFRHFGEWPKVLGCDWCGAYQPTIRATEEQQDATSSPPLARVAAGEKTDPSLPPGRGGHRGQRGEDG